MAGLTVEYYFTVTSPWSYLGHQPFLELAEKHGADVAFKPVDFSNIFPRSGGLPLPERPFQRRRYRMFELQRWRDYRATPLNLRPKHFPTDPGPGNRMVLTAAERGLNAGQLALAIMRACWAEEKDVADRATLVGIATSLGIDGEALAHAAEQPEAAARVEALTEEAIAEHVFGAPTYVVRGEPFWGQDRLEMVERALSGQAGPYTVESPL